MNVILKRFKEKKMKYIAILFTVFTLISWSNISKVV